MVGFRTRNAYPINVVIDLDYLHYAIDSCAQNPMKL